MQKLFGQREAARIAPTNSRQARIEKAIEEDNEEFIRNERQRQLVRA